MAWLHTYAIFFVLSLLLASSLAAVCPESCVCSTTRDGLHRATCSSLPKLYKYTLRQKHHNINILDLSHNNITKITNELSRLSEVVSLDLSTNGLTDIYKFLRNIKKLVHLNLAHNRIEKLSLLHLPISVSSLDLTNNLLKDVPSDLAHLGSLEHLELEGNLLNCSCDNIIARDRLIYSNVHIDDAKCATPLIFKGKSWLELKTKEICKVPKFDLDMMMGDQPVDAIKIGEETTALKSMPLVAKSDLEDGNVIHEAGPLDDEDNLVFMKVGRSASRAHVDEIEGSGDAESTTVRDYIIEPIQERKQKSDLLANEEMISVDKNIAVTETIEGSGEGSGFFGLDFQPERDVFASTSKSMETSTHKDDEVHMAEYDMARSSYSNDDDDDSTPINEDTTTPIIEEFNPEPVHKIFKDEGNSSTMEYPMPPPPTIYQGGPDWHLINNESEIITMKTATSEATRDTTVSERMRVTQVLSQAPSSEHTVTPHKTGTYVCIALIVVLLVGLIGFAITKGQMRKRRDRRLMRQQKHDIEKASKEMVDMNKSLLGKPALNESHLDKKVNGKYELVPTHEAHPKKDRNGEVGNGYKYDGSNGRKTESPRDTNQNKNSSIDNNLVSDNRTPQETSFESEKPRSRKDTNSLSSDEYFVPINDEDGTRMNGNVESDTSQPINDSGDTAMDYLSPSREYTPVYSPDMGRVRIKLTETPKPKTPVLVTRSRSNAGDIIITPSVDGNLRKSTT